MKKLVSTALVVSLFSIAAACSQGDTHPPYLGDCDACGQPITTGGGDSSADAVLDTSKPDSSGQDASGNDSGGSDGSLLDTGTGG